MHLSKPDFSRLYKLQDQVLSWLAGLNTPFYLTGGTALGRFYLHHRYSEDLDLFVNAHPDFRRMVETMIRALPPELRHDPSMMLITNDFARILITSGQEVTLKVEWVNDVAYRPDVPISYQYGTIDTPMNILSNKLTAIVGRDEPKDVFDIIHIALNYAFDWADPFNAAREKAFLNELEVCERLSDFPVEWLHQVHWLMEENNRLDYRVILDQITNDFLLNRTNSMGIGKPHLREATIKP